MGRKRLFEKLGIDVGSINLSHWAMVDTSDFTDSDKEKYEKRRQAVEMYILDKATIREISEITGIDKSEISRFTMRCLSVDEFGDLMGYRGLNPNLHVKSYEREMLPKGNAKNYAGSFELLLNEKPDLRFLIHELVLKTDKNSLQAVYRVKDVHRKFIDKCKELDIGPDQYPRNTVDRGKRSLERYVKDLKERHLGNSHVYGETAAMIARTVGIGEKNHPLHFRPFSHVQFDGHKIDMIVTIIYTDPNGNLVKKTLKRMWLLVVLEVPTRTVLGYLLCVKPEYSQMDVLQCMLNAIRPHEPRTFTIPGLRYPKEGAFPSSCIPESQWAVWREIWMDNAKANLAVNVKDKLTKTVGCFINAGPVRAPLRRGFVERFFGILADNGYHLTPSTTGSNPNDPRRKNAEKRALKKEITIEHLEELTEVMIADYNNDPHSGISYNSPLEAMRSKIERGYLPRIMPEHRRQDLGLLTISTTCTVKGNASKGRRPFINYEGAQYRNDLLSNSTNLIGTKLTIYINLMDLRTVRAFLPNGNELGFLRVSGKWVMTPHSLETRKAINSMRRKKTDYFLDKDDYVQAYYDHLATSNSKADKNRLAHEQRYQKEQSQQKEDENVVIEVEIQEEHVHVIVESKESILKPSIPPDLQDIFKPISM